MKKSHERFLVILLIVICFFILVEVGYSLDKVEQSIEATVTINPIYEILIEIDILTEFVGAGDNLSVLVDLEKINLIAISEEIEISLDYEILKKGKLELIDSGYIGSVFVGDEKETIVVEIQTPIGMRPGKYILKINATHPQAYGDEDEDDFWIRKKLYGNKGYPKFSFLSLLFLVYLF